PKVQNVRCNNKNYKYFKKNDLQLHRARIDSDSKLRRKYQADMKSGKYKNWSETECKEMDDFAARETIRVCQELFHRPAAETSGEAWLVHHVVVGDLPLAAAQSLVRLLCLHQISGTAL